MGTSIFLSDLSLCLEGGMYGKLGHGNESGISVPKRVDYLQGHRVVQVACGSRHTVALLDNHDVYTWGDKESGVTGHGDTEGHQFLPQAIETLKGLGAHHISACGFHTAVLCDQGHGMWRYTLSDVALIDVSVYTFGEGKFGRLGNNSERDQLVPQRVEELVGQRVTQVTCGGFHTAAITVTGLTFTWGGGEHGQVR